MTRATATFTISVPPEMAAEIERVRADEHRTRSELVREALRQYIRAATVRSVKERIARLPEEEALADEIDAVEEGRRASRAARRKDTRRAVDRRTRHSRPERA